MIISVRDNIVLQSRSKNDAPEMFKVIDANRSHLRTWLPWVDGTDSPAVTENVIASWEQAYERGRDVVLGICEGSEYIGNIGLHDIKRHNQSGMIGYWLAEKSQGRGIMTDCVRALANYGFGTLGLNRIYIHCAAGNKKSRAVPERLGFKLEGTLQDSECLYGVFHDMIVYGMVRRNWVQTETLCLIPPAPEHKEAALEYKQEHIDNGETHIHGSGGLMKAEDYENWLEKITSARTSAQTGWVDCSTYFMFIFGRIVGTIQIRHTLNDSLMKSGGHIGYGIRPSERRKGYGAKMLGLALEECRELCIGRALVTCDRDNIASAKTILKNGGILENEIVDENGNILRRYWVKI